MGRSSRTTTAAHFYNWPYTYGLLFGLGLFARYRDDPDRFRAGYDDLLSRAGMDTAEELGAAFGLDVTDEAFWTASLDVARAPASTEYERLVDDRRSCVTDVAVDHATTSTATSSPTLLAGEPRYRVDQVWQGLYEQLADTGRDDQPAEGAARRARRRPAAGADARSPSRSATAATRSSSCGSSTAAAASRPC